MTIGTVVLLIAVLACPAIMYWMMRSHRSHGTDGEPTRTGSRAGHAEGEDRP